MEKLVNLSVHKNTKRQRESKQIRTKAIRNFKDCVNKSDVVGYAIAAWDRDGKVTTCCDTSSKDSPITAATLPESLRTYFLDRFING